ncbi:MAG: hypothetical protein OXC19_26240 [Bryobacterales bacterium]|nr:hypothetical protein [Bryobacterales bacterium]
MDRRGFLRVGLAAPLFGASCGRTVSNDSPESGVSHRLIAQDKRHVAVVDRDGSVATADS